jgi:hypothetical protein
VEHPVTTDGVRTTVVVGARVRGARGRVLGTRVVVAARGVVTGVEVVELAEVGEFVVGADSAVLLEVEL